MDLFNTTLKLQQVSQEVVFKFCWKNKTKTRRPQITSESFCDWTWEQIQPGFEMFWPGGPALTNSLRMDVNSRSERGPTHTAGAQLNRKKTKKKHTTVYRRTNKNRPAGCLAVGNMALLPASEPLCQLFNASLWNFVSLFCFVWFTFMIVVSRSGSELNSKWNVTFKRTST